MRTVWLANKGKVGIPSGRRQVQRLGGETTGMWLEVREGENLTGEKGPSQQSPTCPPFCSTPLQSDSYQEDIYPMTPGTEPALTPDEWLGGINRGTTRGGLPRRERETAILAFSLAHPLPLA